MLGLVIRALNVFWFMMLQDAREVSLSGFLLQ